MHYWPNARSRWPDTNHILKHKKWKGRGGRRKVQRGKGIESLSFSPQSPLPFALLSPPLWTHATQATFWYIADRNEVEVAENTQKRKRPISSHIERTSLVKKAFITSMYTFIKYLFCGTNAGNPERARCSLLARSGSQSEYRIRVILPARGFSHVIRRVKEQLEIGNGNDRAMK